MWGGGMLRIRVLGAALLGAALRSCAAAGLPQFLLGPTPEMGGFETRSMPPVSMLLEAAS